MIEDWYKSAQSDSNTGESYPSKEMKGKKVIPIYDDDIPKENQHGNCYEASLRCFQDNVFRKSPESKTMVLVHGIPTGQGAISGIKFGHAWVEYLFEMESVKDYELWIVIDPANNISGIPREMYYKIGNINLSETVRYTYAEAKRMMSEHLTYGPWDKNIFDNARGSKFKVEETEGDEDEFI